MKTSELVKNQLKSVPDLKPGDTVRVHARIIEGNKERIQIFEGVVLRVKGSGTGKSFTVRKISYGVGVERVFLINSPRLAKIEIVKRAKIRRAYLTYLRSLTGKSARLKEKQFDSLAVNVKEVELKPEDLAPPATEEVDQELTELNVEEIEEPKETVSLENLADEEEQNNAENQIEIDEDESQAPLVEMTEGIEQAEEDQEKAESHEGKRSEKITEKIKQ